MARLSNKEKLKSLLTITSSATAFFSGLCIYQNNEKFYEEIAMPLTRFIDPELAHKLAINVIKFRLVGNQRTQDPDILKTQVWGIKFVNPIGMAAGFDKQGEAVKGLHGLGFSFVEVGSVTPQPQAGNPKPRVFRLPEDNAVINCYGFNSEGHDVVLQRLQQLKSSNFTGVIGVNLGKNKTSEDSVQDYVSGIIKFSDVADYFVINVSSPNTPGLRNLQNKNNLQQLLIKLNETRHNLKCDKPLLLKLAPDLTDREKQDIVEVILKEESKVDGLIVCNTTLSRENLVSQNKDKVGGLSGAPLSKVSTAMISDMYRMTQGKVPIIGVGGVFSGQDAFEKIKAGASLIQIYTSYVYHGPPIVGKIKRELSELLKQEGFSNISDAVGTKPKIKL